MLAFYKPKCGYEMTPDTGTLGCWVCWVMLEGIQHRDVQIACH